MKKALITGSTGQDGSWLSKILLEAGYEVYGTYRRTASQNFWRHKYLKIDDKIKAVELDLLDYSNIYNVITTIRPDEVYNLAAQSFVGVSFKQPISTCNVTGMSVLYMLDILKNWSPHTKFYQASSSEMFGLVQEVPQTEKTPLYPRSPYGCAKCFGHFITNNYRESYNMFCCSGILYNHESELRGIEFVTKKISDHVAKYHWDTNKKPLELGNLDARRDWGHAEDYCMGMYQMMQHEKSDSYILSTGKMHSVRDFVNAAFDMIGVKVEWTGHGSSEVGHSQQGDLLVRVNPEYYRPAEVEQLCGDSSKARQTLNWQPKYSFDNLVESMVKFDIDSQS